MCFNFFTLMKRRRLTTSLHLASSVLAYLLSLFRHCLFSFSILSFSNWWSLSFSVSLSVSFSVRDLISSMNSKHCRQIHHFIWHSRLHLHALKLRELSQCWIIERLFFYNYFFHFHINIILRRIFQWFFVFCILRSFTRSCNLWFLHLRKKIDW
jgi:hypothetical protein